MGSGGGEVDYQQSPEQREIMRMVMPFIQGLYGGGGGSNWWCF
jgi:hypothetical protein